MFNNLFTVYAGKQTADFQTRQQCYKYKTKLRKEGNTQTILMVDPDGLSTHFLFTPKKEKHGN